MKTDDEVYGIGVKPLRIPQDVINDRLEKLYARIGEINLSHYLVRDLELKTAIQGHIDFWKNINKMGVSDECI